MSTTEQLFRQRELTEDEVASDSQSPKRHVSVLEATRPINFSTLHQGFQGEGGMARAVNDSLLNSGAVLLRDFPIDQVDQAETLLQTLNIQFDHEYLGGGSPRSKLSDHFFTSTDAPPSYIVGFHTEMCYLRRRPGKVFFYCMEEPEKYGETIVFDCAAAWQVLPPELREKIETLGMRYQRYFMPKKAKFFNIYVSWMDAFNTQDREEAEQACTKQGLSFKWRKNGGLDTWNDLPGVLSHPKTGEQCLSLTLFNGHAMPDDIDRFAPRMNLLTRYGLSNLVKYTFKKKTVFMRTLWGDGSEITKAETQVILDAVWKGSTLFNWRKDDLLLLDNIRCGHGRMNVTQPRRIAAALGDTYSLDEMTEYKQSVSA